MALVVPDSTHPLAINGTAFSNKEVPAPLNVVYDITSTLLGSGGFGSVYKMTDVATGKDVAVKVEMGIVSSLKYEYEVFRRLPKFPGFPEVYAFGSVSGRPAMSMEILGHSLEFYHKKHKTFSVGTIIPIALQILEHIQVLHAVDFLYRDVKPDNFVFGVGAKSKVLHIVDMGLAKCYRTPKTKKIIACREGKSLTGTPRYASLNVHRGLETSRRDDIESLAYMLIYLYVGSLPWQGTPARSKPAKYKAIYDLKCKFVPDQLCGPSFLRTMLVHALSLQYEDEPDYHFLRTMLHEAAQEHKVNLIDPVFDWDVPASLGVSYPPRTESVYLKSIQPLQMRVAALETQNAALIKETEQLRTQLKDAQNTAELLIWENRTMVTPANARRRSIKIIRQGKQVQAVRVEPQDTVLAKRKAPDVPVVSDQPSKKPKV